MHATELDRRYAEILEKLSQLLPASPRSSVDDAPRWLQRAASQLTQVLDRAPVQFLDVRLRSEEEPGRIIAFTNSAVVNVTVAPGRVNGVARTVTSVVPRRNIVSLNVTDDNEHMLSPTPGKWPEGQAVQLNYPGLESLTLPLSLDPLRR